MFSSANTTMLGSALRVDVATGESTRVVYNEKNAGASVIAGPEPNIVLASKETYKRKRGLFRLFEMPETIVTFGVARLNTEDFRTLLTVEFAQVVSFGQVSEKPAR